MVRGATVRWNNVMYSNVPSHPRTLAPPHLSLGPVAQRLERPAHNRLVPGSNPGGPTSLLPSAGFGWCGYAVRRLSAQAIGGGRPVPNVS